MAVTATLAANIAAPERHGKLFMLSTLAQTGGAPYARTLRFTRRNSGESRGKLISWRWMAVLTVSGQPGCRVEEVARLTAQKLGIELFTESALNRLVEEQFGSAPELPDKAWPHLLSSILARVASKHHVAVCLPGAEFVLRSYPAVLRAYIVAPAVYRTGMLMLERGLERPDARELLARLDKELAALRRRRFGRAAAPPDLFNLTLNAAFMETEEIAGLLADAARRKGLLEQGVMSSATEREIQFQVRLNLARYQISPPDDLGLERPRFEHPSEEIFASLLDFYRIAWEYEPRSFPLEWDDKGNVLEAFTPDFYLPEFDLYVELTTMKQALVTRKNRKIRRLRKLYPHINIQIFYQKDFQNLIFKYGLVERTMRI